MSNIIIFIVIFLLFYDIYHVYVIYLIYVVNPINILMNDFTYVLIRSIRLILSLPTYLTWLGLLFDTKFIVNIIIYFLFLLL